MIKLYSKINCGLVPECTDHISYKGKAQFIIICFGYSMRQQMTNALTCIRGRGKLINIKVCSWIQYLCGWIQYLYGWIQYLQRLSKIFIDSDFCHNYLHTLYLFECLL